MFNSLPLCQTGSLIVHFNLNISLVAFVPDFQDIVLSLAEALIHYIFWVFQYSLNTNLSPPIPHP